MTSLRHRGTSPALSERRGDDPERWRDQAYPSDYQAQVQRAIGFSGIKHDFFVEGKAHWLARFMGRAGFQAPVPALVDIGCGVGLLHPYLEGLAQSITGIDLSSEAIAEAAQRNPNNNYRTYDGLRLPAADGEFDLALAVTVMHHVPVAQWQHFVAEAHRVLRPGGAFVVIEHNPFNPLTLYVVNRCDIDADAVLLKASQTRALMRKAGFHGAAADYVFFTPFRSNLVQWVERQIDWLPFGAQYAAYGFKGAQTAQTNGSPPP